MSDIVIREIKKDDLQNGFLESIDSLRQASDLDSETARKILENILSNPAHMIFVAEYDGKIVGSTTLFIEQKFIHKGGLVGHIEDVVVTKQLQGKNIGAELIRHSLNYAKNQGCYKTILDCTDDVLGFYEKLGFIRHSSCMRFDH